MALDNIEKLQVGSFGYVFQPIVNSNKCIVGFEALARCSAAMNMSVYQGSASLISLVPFKTQCHEFFRSVSQLVQLYGSTYHYAFNVEPSDCTEDSIWLLVKLAQAYGVPCSCIELEIIESSRTSLSIPALKLAKDFGFTLVLDDFGVGYSNVESLLDYPFDRVKFDKVFTLNQGERLPSQLLSAVHKVVQACGFSTVIEGVESKSLMDFAVGLSADFYQGFLFGRGDSLEDMLNVPLNIECK